MRRGESKNRGAAVVEFAVVLPLLLIIVFGILEFGFVWLQSHYIANSAREGARIAAKLENIEDGDGSVPFIQVGVRNHLAGLGLGPYRNLDDADITMQFNGSGTSKSFVTIEAREGTLAEFGVGGNGIAQEILAVRVQVRVRTEEFWKPILWGLLNTLYGGDLVELNEISESAVFARQ